MSRRDRVLRFIGLVVVVVTLDATSGVAWKLFTRSELTAPVTSRLGLTRDGTFLDADAAGPALREYPWAGDHLRDMQRLPQSYWPFVLTRPDEFTSETVTVRGWARRTYRPEGIGTDRPLVALFGGSTAFGEGQRDEHTIASELARLAEEAGTPIRVVNYGQRSWSLWQEALLFEMLTGGDGGSERPDLAVFYDGANDMLHQLQPSTAGWPTHFNVDGVARTLTGAPPGGDSQGLQERTVAGDVADWYAERSTILRAYRGLRRVLGISDDRASDPTTDAPPEVVADNTADVYERGRAIVEDVAARRGIDTAFYWQPMPTDTGDAYTFATRQVGRPTVVIADALDDDQWVYFDDIHTNERGARLVAERMWETLGPQVRTLA